MPELLTAIIVICFVGILLLAIYLVTVLLKQHNLHRLYAENARDFRFVCELLRLFIDKDSIIKNPCLLKNYDTVSPRADALIVGGGGLLVLTVIDEPGQYSTPPSGNWTVWQNGEMKQIPNGFRAGKQYVSVLTNIMMKNGLSCPVVNLVVLTDDHAELDSLHEENVLTGDLLVPYVKDFNRRRALGRGGQAKLIKAIKQHHEHCLRRLSTAMVSDASAVFEHTGEFPRVENERALFAHEDDRPTDPETAAKEIPIDEVAEEMPTEEASVDSVEQTNEDRESKAESAAALDDTAETEKNVDEKNGEDIFAALLRSFENTNPSSDDDVG